MKVYLESLGCDKNLVDSEKMLKLLADRGHILTDDPAEAEAVIVNTCCFIGDAKQESIDAVLRLAEYKKAGTCKALIVTGCLAERYRDEILNEIKEVDAVLGTAHFDRIADELEAVLKGKREVLTGDVDGKVPQGAGRVLSIPSHFAYLKIAEGCDKGCTYCVIPKVRGRYRSTPMEDLEREAADLASRGVKELILVAQETTVYGVDLYGEKKLPKLLKRLAATDGIVWIRLLYCYPEEITDELIRVIRENDKICDYIDMPIQHISDRILKQMGRRTSSDEIRRIIVKLKEEIPDIAIRTTLISGFPGETRADHFELTRFVKEMGFDRLGVFAYSREEGTPAAKFARQVSERTKARRKDEIMRVQQAVAFKKSESFIGRELDALIEGKVSDSDVYAARTYRDAPDVDGLIFIRTERELMSGDFVRVKVTAAKGYDLAGELLP